MPPCRARPTLQAPTTKSTGGSSKGLCTTVLGMNTVCRVWDFCSTASRAAIKEGLSIPQEQLNLKERSFERLSVLVIGNDGFLMTLKKSESSPQRFQTPRSPEP